MANLKHVAISLDDVSAWCRKNNISFERGCGKYFKNIHDLLIIQIKLDIPILTIYILPDSIDKQSNEYLIYSDFIAGFFTALQSSSLLQEQKIKISVLGKWYKLPGKSVEAIKEVIEATSNYERFFANFCIDYDGQEEIVDACRLIARQVELGKIGPDMITKDTIKENTYSSYFLAPDIIFIYGEKKLSSLLLWDSAFSYISFAEKSFMEFEEQDFDKIKIYS